MTTRRLTRRGFLQGVGGVAVSAALAHRLPGARAEAAEPRAGKRLRFGIHTHPQHTTWGDLLHVWEEADELGIDTAFAFDHFIPIRGDTNGPCLEGWTLLSALAARTRRIQAGLLVTGNTYRYPAVLAKMAATVDHVSGGRCILGMGAGWYELEHAAYGIPFHTPGNRARRLVESVEVVKRLFTEPKATYTGKYYQLKDAPCEPKPLQRPHLPILIGGMGPKVVQPLAARHADIWHFFAPPDLEATRKTITHFDDLVRQAGREPASVEKAMSVQAPDVKNAKALQERLRTLAEIGVGHFILSLAAPFDGEAMRQWAKEIAPAVKA